MSETIRLDQQLCFAIYQAHKTFNHFYAEALAPFKLTYAQYVVLLVLYQQDNLSVKALGQQVGLDSGTLTPLLKRLEKDHWVIRQRSRVDERRLEIVLTPYAKKQQQPLFQRVNSCQKTLQLPPDQYQKLMANMQQLVVQLQQGTKALATASEA